MPTRPRAPTARVAIALGSNLGDRHQHLAWAVGALSSLGRDWRVSAFAESAPQGVPDRQPEYLNAVAVGTSTLPPRGLLEALLAFEAERGRTRLRPKAARTLDLDLVLYDGVVIDEPDLQVPHPRFRERAFVLAPLADLAPRWRDPISGRTMAELWRALRAAGEEADRKATRRSTR